MDGTIKVWKSDTGELLATLLAGADGEWLTLTPEGFFDASEKGADLLSVVRGLDAYSIDQFYQALHRPDLVRENWQGKVRDAAARLNLTKLIASGPAPKWRSPRHHGRIQRSPKSRPSSRRRSLIKAAASAEKNTV